MTAREKQNSNQTDRGPDIAVLDDREEVWPGNADEGYCAKDGRCNGNSSNPVYWSTKLGVWSIMEMASNPGMDLLRCLWSD